MDFIAVDVETANPNMSSICQIGVVVFESGKEVYSKTIFVNPETWFAPTNIQIHGITEQNVIGAQNFSHIINSIREITENQTVVSHTHFDRVALNQACQKYDIPNLSCQWLDTARVSRRTWEAFSKKGYGLKNLANYLGLKFEHHNAEQDARTAGLILIEAIRVSGISLNQWMKRVESRNYQNSSIKRFGNSEGVLSGETIVFTGALSLPRKDAANRAAEAGANVSSGITKKTSILVVGDQDIDRLAGKSKSSKHIKAEKLMSDGQEIKIIGESDFLALSSAAA